MEEQRVYTKTQLAQPDGKFYPEGVDPVPGVRRYGPENRRAGRRNKYYISLEVWETRVGTGRHSQTSLGPYDTLAEAVRDLDPMRQTYEPKQRTKRKKPPVLEDVDREASSEDEDAKELGFVATGHQRSTRRRRNPLQRPKQNTERRVAAVQKKTAFDTTEVWSRIKARFQLRAAFKRRALGFSRNKVDRRKAQGHDAEEERQERRDAENFRKELAKRFRRRHMARLEEKIQSNSEVELLLHSASSTGDDGVDEEIRDEANSKFTENQILRCRKQACLVHAYLHLLDTEHFSVAEGGKDVETLATKAVMGSPYRGEISGRTLLIWAADYARNGGYFTKDLRGSYQRMSWILYIVHNQDLLLELKTWIKRNLKTLSVSAVQNYVAATLLPKISAEEKKKYKIPDKIRPGPRSTC